MDTVGEDLFQIVRKNFTQTPFVLDTKEDALLFDKLSCWGAIVNGAETSKGTKKAPIFSVSFFLQMLQIKLEMTKEFRAKKKAIGSKTVSNSTTVIDSSSLTLPSSSSVPSSSPQKAADDSLEEMRDVFSIDLQDLLQRGCLLKCHSQTRAFERFFASFIFMREMMHASKTLEEYRTNKAIAKNEGQSDQSKLSHRTELVQDYLSGFKFSPKRTETRMIELSPGRLIEETASYSESHELRTGDVFVPLEEDHPAFDFLMVAQQPTIPDQKVVLLFESKFSNTVLTETKLEAEELRGKLDTLMKTYRKGENFEFGRLRVLMKDVIYVVVSSHPDSPEATTFDDHPFPGEIFISDRRILNDFLGEPLNNCGALLSSRDSILPQKRTSKTQTKTKTNIRTETASLSSNL